MLSSGVLRRFSSSTVTGAGSFASRTSHRRSAWCASLMGSVRTFSHSSVGAGRSPGSAYDIVIVGGGAIGSSCAYFLGSKLSGSSTKVLVIERDPTYRFASSALSASSIRHQFSTAENVAIGQFGAQFLRKAADYLTTQADSPVDVQFREGGYLFLSSESGRPILEANNKLQRTMTSDVVLLNAEQVKHRFPWLSGLTPNPEMVDCGDVKLCDVVAGSFGTKGEGWFDAWSLMTGFRKKAQHFGVTYVSGEVTGIDVDANSNRVTGLRYRPLHQQSGSSQTIPPVSSAAVSTTVAPPSVFASTEQYIKCGFMVNCAGSNAGRISQMIGVDLPVVPKKRCVFVFSVQPGSGINNCPLVIDPSGVYWRPDAPNQFICGVSPPEKEDVDAWGDFQVDHSLFERFIWPILATRVPAFNAVKVTSSWAGHYDYNTFDQNGVVGAHPRVKNFVYANGFSGHGLQQSPAVGRGVSELILEGQYATLDLARFGYERILDNRPIVELNVV